VGRPSKLSSVQEREILQRLAAGESNRSVAKDFNVGEATIRRIFSAQVPKVKDVAQRLAVAEKELESMPVSAQRATRTLADQLKDIGTNLASAARFGSATASRLAELAHGQLDGIQAPDGSLDGGKMLNIGILTRTANEAAVPALRLVVATQGNPPDAPDEEDRPTLSNLSDAELDQFIVLQQKARS